MRDDCRVIGHALLEYVYGDLDEVQRNRVDRHLAHCAGCADDLQGYRDTLALIDESTLEPSEEISEHFSNVVVAILKRRDSNRRLPAIRAMAAACLACFLMVGAGGYSEAPIPNRDPSPTTVSLAAQVAELGDPLISQLAFRNLAFSAGVKSLSNKEARS